MPVGDADTACPPTLVIVNCVPETAVESRQTATLREDRMFTAPKNC